MEIPDKIYLYPSRIRKGTIQNNWFRTQYNQDSIGFFRSDAFIEKATSYIQQHWIWNTKIIEDFKNYMEGE